MTPELVLQQGKAAAVVEVKQPRGKVGVAVRAGH
jgi:hypothetical protein